MYAHAETLTETGTGDDGRLHALVGREKAARLVCLRLRGELVEHARTHGELAVRVTPHEAREALEALDEIVSQGAHVVMGFAIYADGMGLPMHGSTGGHGTIRALHFVAAWVAEARDGLLTRLVERWEVEASQCSDDRAGHARAIYRACRWDELDAFNERARRWVAREIVRRRWVAL